MTGDDLWRCRERSDELRCLWAAKLALLCCALLFAALRLVRMTADRRETAGDTQHATRLRCSALNATRRAALLAMSKRGRENE